MKFSIPIGLCFLIQTSCQSLIPVRTGEMQSSSSHPLSSLRVAVIQGTTTESATVIHVVDGDERPLKWTIEPSAKLKIETSQLTPRSIGLNNTAGSHFAKGSVHRFEIHNLVPNQTYTLSFEFELSLGQTAPDASLHRSFSFRVLTPSSHGRASQRSEPSKPLQSNRWNFAVLSCLSDDYSTQSSKMTEALYAAQPEMIFLIGDNIYADVQRGKFVPVEVPEQLWNRYVESLLSSTLFQQSSLRPIFTVWDDHDYGVNDGDANFQFRTEALKIRNVFWPEFEPSVTTAKPERNSSPQKPLIEFEKGLGASSLLRVNGTVQNQFLFLDNRSFRSPKKNTTPGTEPTHFGREQVRWIQRHTQNFKGFTWLISGDQWFGAYHPFESFERHAPDELEDVLDHLVRNRMPFALLSGDRHLSEVMKIGPKDLKSKAVREFKTFEFTSSGFYAKTYPGRWNETPNPRQIKAADRQLNFTVFRFAHPLRMSKMVDFDYQIEAEARGLGSIPLYRFSERASFPGH